MDLEDNETAMTSFDTQVEDLKSTIEEKQNLISDIETKLEESKAQVKREKKKNYINASIFVLDRILTL